MGEEKTRRLKQVATTLNIGTATIVDYLSDKGFDMENKPTTKITAEQFGMLAKEFASSMQDKIEAEELNIGRKQKSCTISAFSSNEQISGRHSFFSYSDTYSSSFDRLLSFFSVCLEDNTEKPKFRTIPPTGRYRLKYVASALNTSVPILAVILKTYGHSVEEKSNAKITADQLQLLVEHFAADITNDLLLSADWHFDYEEYFEILSKYPLTLNSISSDLRVSFVKLRMKEKPKKKSLQDIKTRIQSIITPKLYHVFTGEEDSRAANHCGGFSTVLLNHTREACLNSFNFKTCFLDEKLTAA